MQFKRSLKVLKHGLVNTNNFKRFFPISYQLKILTWIFIFIANTHFLNS